MTLQFDEEGTHFQVQQNHPDQYLVTDKIPQKSLEHHADFSDQCFLPEIVTVSVYTNPTSNNFKVNLILIG